MSVSGSELKYGFKKAAAWNTAVACGAGNGFLGLDLSLKADTTNLTDDSRGQLFAVDSSAGEVKCEGSVPAYLRYNDATLLSMLAIVMGTSAAPVLHAAGTLSYDHILKVALNNDGLFGTLCAALGTVGVEEIPSWKPNKVNIKWDTGKPVQVTVSGAGIDVTTSGENTLVTFNNVTILERANRAYMGQTAILLNAQSGIALAAGDKLGASSIELTFERKQSGVYGSFVSADAAPRDLIDEPTGDGMFEASLKLQFPRTANLAARADLKNNTSKKAEIICTGPIIEGAIPYLLKLQMPHLKPKQYENPYESGIIKNVREYDVLGATTAPTGMTGNTDPLWIMATNKIATSLLA
jgi:hypothetical protein